MDQKESVGSIRLNSMEKDIFNRFDSGKIIKLLGELPDNQKQVIVMRYVDELPPAEIAYILGESANAVSVRINQATKKIRQILDNKQNNAKPN